MSRVLVMGRRAVVSAAHPLAAEAGLAMLRAGGNAVDAAIAANAVLGVVRPGTCGIGGDLFALVYDPRDMRVTCINGSGRSSEEARPERYTEAGLSEVPTRGGLAVTVPGCVHAWETLHRRFGRIAWPDLFAPAIHCARDGWPVSERTHRQIARAAQSGEFSDAWRAVFAKQLPERPGGLYRIPAAARALEAIAAGGAAAFYRGEIARAIVTAVRAEGGVLTLDDLAGHATEEVAPLKLAHRGCDVYQTPPNSQGLVALVALYLYDRFRGREIRALRDPLGATIHRQVSAFLKGFAAAEREVADSASMRSSPQAIIEAATSPETVEGADLERLPPETGGLPSHGDTTALACADGDGWMVVILQSLYHNMGSRVTAPEWGIVLQSRGAGFTLQKGHPNCIAPRKRPRHTLCATLVVKDGRPHIGFGTEGGHLQPQVHLQVLSRMFDHGEDIQRAIEHPRWAYDVTTGTLRLEGRFPAEAADALRSFGYRVQVEAPYSGMGQSHGVQEYAPGTLAGGADPRSEGYVLWL